MKTLFWVSLVLVNVCWGLDENGIKNGSTDQGAISVNTTSLNKSLGTEQGTFNSSTLKDIIPPGPPSENNSTVAPTTSTTSVPHTTTSVPPKTTSVAPNVTTTAAPNVTTTIAPNVTTTTTKPTPPTKPTPITIPSSTVHPSTTALPGPTPSPNNRKFDGPSFVGGIVLASGLMAIAFVAFKFYKARTELNYHTL